MYKLIIFFVVILFFKSCNSRSDESYYEPNPEITENQWIAVLNSIGYDNQEINNSVIIVTSTSQCQSCIQELDFWNDFYQTENQEVKLLLIINEKFEIRYRNFLERNSLTLPTLQDSTGILNQKGYVPAVPVKLYFDNSGQNKRIHPVGNDPSLREFVNSLK